MFFLHASNRVERLLDRLAVLIDTNPPKSVLTNRTFLIQNRGMERLLSQELASRFGSWCNGSTLMPDQFVDLLRDHVLPDSETTGFDRDVMSWRIERLLRSSTADDQVVLSRYLDGERRELKRYQLACRLADLFERYQITRADLLDKWDAGQAVWRDSTELWQRRLWQQLRAELPAALHRGALITALAKAVSRYPERLPDHLGQLYIFGQHVQPPLMLHLFNALAWQIDIHYLLLTPCREYWGDIGTRRSRRRNLSTSEDTESAAIPTIGQFHPLLVSLGQQGAHFQEVLLDTIDQLDGSDDFIDPLASGKMSILRRIQQDLLDGCAPPASVPETIAQDASLTVVACHSRRREIEILKDFLYSRLDEDKTLAVHDIIIMAPDIEAYAALIPAIFADVPHDICDCRHRYGNRLLDGFILFLRIFSGRYGWSELLGVLERPEIFPQFGLAATELDLIRHWVITVGIRWGLSAEQCGEDGWYPINSGSWRSGMERLLMGLAVGNQEAVDGILPYPEIDGSQGEALAGLYRFVALIESARKQIGEPVSLPVWAKRLRKWCDRLFGSGDQPDLFELLHLIDALEQRYADHNQEPIGRDTIVTWITAMADKRSSAGFLNGRLTFCSLQPMRPAPFRIVCLLGMNDSDFPREDRSLAFDLTIRQYRKGDRTRRADDRYQFLEAILNAQDTLYVSFIGQSILTAKPIAPSVVVTELLETIERYYGITGMVCDHPLQSFSRQYFDGSGLYSYDRELCQLAKTIDCRPAHQVRPWLAKPLLVPPIERLGIAELALFLKHPQRYLLRDILGIRLDGKEVYPREEELFDLHGLDRFLGERELIAGLLQGETEKAVLSRLQTELRWPLGAPGGVMLAQRSAAMGGFIDNIKRFGGVDPLPPVEVDLTVGDVVLSGRLEHLTKVGLLFYRFGALRGGDILKAWLYHLVAGLVLDEPVATRLLGDGELFVLEPSRGTPEDLHVLIDLYQQGCCFPSSLFVEPGLAYARQVISNRGRGRKPPIEAAKTVFLDQVSRGYCPEYPFLFREMAVGAILDQAFVDCCEAVLVPLLDWNILDEEEQG